MHNVFVPVCTVICAAGIAIAAAAQTPPSPAPSGPDYYYGAYMPPGPARTALKTNCEICHSGDMYATQRLSEPIWDAEVTKMMKFGSPLPASDKAMVIAYLAKYLGPTVPRIDAVPTATAPPVTYASPPADR